MTSETLTKWLSDKNKLKEKFEQQLRELIHTKFEEICIEVFTEHNKRDKKPRIEKAHYWAYL